MTLQGGGVPQRGGTHIEREVRGDEQADKMSHSSRCQDAVKHLHSLPCPTQHKKIVHDEPKSVHSTAANCAKINIESRDLMAMSS